MPNLSDLINSLEALRHIRHVLREIIPLLRETIDLLKELQALLGGSSSSSVATMVKIALGDEVDKLKK